jgi:hypothetical protein
MQHLFGLNAECTISMLWPWFTSGQNKNLTFETLLYYATVIKRGPLKQHTINITGASHCQNTAVHRLWRARDL